MSRTLLEIIKDEYHGGPQAIHDAIISGPLKDERGPYYITPPERPFYGVLVDAHDNYLHPANDEAVRSAPKLSDDLLAKIEGEK